MLPMHSRCPVESIHPIASSARKMIPSATGIHPEGSSTDQYTKAGTSEGTSALKELPSTADIDDHLVRLSSSSDSSSCSSFDPFQLDERVNANGSSASNGHQKAETTVSGSSFGLDHEDCIAGSSLRVPKQSNDELAEPSSGPTASYHSLDSSSSSGSTTQSPLVQVMERTSDSNGGTPSPYRIPSSVFARTKSSAPQEWSMTSNESVFSIHVGNMSFHKDLYWMNKSGELGKGAELIISPHLMDYSSNQPPTPLVDHSSNQSLLPLIDHPSNPPSPKPGNHSIDIFKKNMTLDEGLHATPEAVETMKAVLRENAETEHEKENSFHTEGASCHSATASPSHLSSASGASNRSFVFPILGGDGVKSSSSKIAAGSIRQHSQSVRPNPEPQSPTLQVHDKPRANEAAASGDARQTRLFPCFSCCSFCS